MKNIKHDGHVKSQRIQW